MMNLLVLLLLTVNAHQHWGSGLARNEVTHDGQLELDQLPMICNKINTVYNTAKFKQFADISVQQRLLTFILHKCQGQRRSSKQQQRLRLFHQSLS